jgi:hypothetical protein
VPDQRHARRWPVLAAAIATVAIVAAAILTRTGSSQDPAAVTPARHQPPVSATSSGSGAPSEGDEGRDGVGAAAVAVRVATASQRWLYLTDEQVAGEVTGLATAEAGPWLAEETVAEIRSARDQLGSSPGAVWWLVRPMATRVERANAHTAQVSVWVVTVLSAVEIAAPQAEWVTVTVDLDWTPEGWRVDGVREEPGPTPMTGPRDGPWDAMPFDDALSGFVRLDGEAVKP